MKSNETMIEVNHLSHLYVDENGNDVRALDDVSLTIRRGEYSRYVHHLMCQNHIR